MKAKKTPITPEQKEFNKIKRFIQKRHPGAYTIQRADGSYAVVNAQGKSVVDPELLLPPAPTVREAWNQAKYTNWFQNMIRKSNAAFSDDKFYKKKGRKKDRSEW